MPLQFAYDRSSATGDTTLATAWARIEKFEWTRSDGPSGGAALYVTVGVYADATAGAAKQPIVLRTFVAQGATANQIVTAADVRAAIQAWLKTQPFFAGASDV